MAGYKKCIVSVHSACEKISDFRPYLSYICAMCLKNESIYSYFPNDETQEDGFPLKVPVPLYRVLEDVLNCTEDHSHAGFVRILKEYERLHLFESWKDELKNPSAFIDKCLKADLSIDNRLINHKEIHDDILKRINKKSEIDKDAKSGNTPKCKSFEVDGQQMELLIENLKNNESSSNVRIPVCCYSTYATLFLVDNKQVPEIVKTGKDSFYYQVFSLTNTLGTRPIDYASEFSDFNDLFSSDYGIAKECYRWAINTIICTVVSTPSPSIAGLPPSLKRILKPIPDNKVSDYCDAFAGESRASMRGESKDTLE